MTNCLLKNLVAETRPYDVANFTDLIVKKPKDYSFPSGHTAASFAAVTALFMSRKKLLGAISCVIAILIAFSRMYLYVHFPTDIIGGIVVGVASRSGEQDLYLERLIRNLQPRRQAQI